MSSIEEPVLAAFEAAYDKAIDLHADDGPYCDLPAVRAGLAAARPLIAAEVRAEVAAAIRADSDRCHIFPGSCRCHVESARIATEEAP